MVSRITFVKLFLALILVLSALSLGRKIWKNLEGARRIESLRKELEVAKEKNRRLGEELSEKESLEFVEKEAREKLGMVREGEKVLILPKKDERGKETATFGSSRETSHFREWGRVFGF